MCSDPWNEPTGPVIRPPTGEDGRGNSGKVAVAVIVPLLIILIVLIVVLCLCKDKIFKKKETHDQEDFQGIPENKKPVERPDDSRKK